MKWGYKNSIKISVLENENQIIIKIQKIWTFKIKTKSSIWNLET